MIRPAPLKAKSLKSYVDRIENLEGEAKAIGTDKRSVFDEAADAGYDKKALRRLLRDRKEAAKDSATAEKAEEYRALLEMPGASYRTVSERVGVSKSHLQRLVPKKKNGTATPHNPETGEIKEPAPDCPPSPVPESGVGAGTNLENAAPQAPASDVPIPTAPLAEGSATPQPAPEGGVGAGTDLDDLTPPPFLDRRKPQVTA